LGDAKGFLSARFTRPVTQPNLEVLSVFKTTMVTRHKKCEWRRVLCRNDGGGTFRLTWVWKARIVRPLTLTYTCLLKANAARSTFKTKGLPN